MTKRREITYGLLAVLLMVAQFAILSHLFGATGSGVSLALFGFIGKAIGAVANVAGKVIGIGGGSDKPIQVTTGTDPAVTQALTALTESNRALAERQQSTVPKWVWILGGVVGVGLVGGVLIFAFKRRR